MPDPQPERPDEPSDDTVVSWELTGTATAYATHPEGAHVPDNTQEKQ